MSAKYYILNFTNSFKIFITCRVFHLSDMGFVSFTTQVKSRAKASYENKLKKTPRAEKLADRQLELFINTAISKDLFPAARQELL